MLRTALACLLASAALSGAPTSAQEGPQPDIAFTMERQRADSVQLSLEYGERGESQHSTSWKLADLRGLDPAALAAPTESSTRFRIVEEAGVVECTGLVGRGAGAGNCRFEPDEAFAEAMARRGVGRPKRADQLVLTLQGASLSLLDALQRAGYPTPAVTDVVAASIHGVDEAYVTSMAASGYRLGDLDDLVAFRIHGVDAAYARAMAAAHPSLKSAPAQQLLAMRIHGVTPDLVQALSDAGVRGLDGDSIVSLRIHGATPRMIRELAAAGHSEMSAADLTAFAIHGVTPAFVRAMAEVGYPNLTPEQLLALKIHGVTPEYARSMAATGRAADELSRAPRR